MLLTLRSVMTYERSMHLMMFLRMVLASSFSSFSPERARSRPTMKRARESGQGSMRYWSHLKCQ